MEEYQELRGKVTPIDELRSRVDDPTVRLDRHHDEAKARIEERMKSRRDSHRDAARHHREAPRSHADRTKMEKEQHEKHREFLLNRKTDFLGRINKANFDPEEAVLLRREAEELHTAENTLVDTRLQITLDFEGVRDITDKVKRREYLDMTKKRREERREVDNVTRERIRELREHIENRLREVERNEL